jgi:hypothetical protein
MRKPILCIPSSALVCSGLLIATAFAQAQTANYIEVSKTIARLGAQGTFYYVVFAEPLSQNCQFGTIYVSPDRKGMYAQLLAAKLANKRISRVDYSQAGGTGTLCSAELVEIAD